MLQLIEAGEQGLAEASAALADTERTGRHLVASDLVTLHAPLPVPAQIRDFSVFPDHIRQAPSGMARIAARRSGNLAALETIKPLADIPPVYLQQPIYYITNRFSVVGPDADVVWPAYSRIMDFELEFAAVIGRKGRDIAREDALAHVFGYMIYNDFSARDTQNIEMQGMLGPAKGKSFDGGNAMGPWLVTADEIPDPQNLKMSVRVNGEIWAEGSSADMLHGVADMIAYVSRHETIYPGEVFGSGTMGNGCGLEVDRYLAHGDVVTLSVEGLGELSNRVVMADGRAA
ncbi:fumarylacetoacetate hydrolase family protein [Rhizobium sp. RU36D]|uniref:fumarylacetoacetate hydrolase family protein n=1 Tax=Rhizobium sp. RU36D TaxID=1907415 RepID=UPI001FCD1952|nr:fumarylacetoacetate hydrolase family protein [Rhizobium sp. RU36D]